MDIDNGRQDSVRENIFSNQLKNFIVQKHFGEKYDDSCDFSMSFSMAKNHILLELYINNNYVTLLSIKQARDIMSWNQLSGIRVLGTEKNK